MHRILRLWFGLSEPVARGTYLLHGAALMGLKYSVDTALVLAVTGRRWTPWDYVSPLFSAKATPIGPAPEWLWVVLALWTLPFLWIGVSMSLRRALDAGLSPWVCLLFFLPLVNWLLMASLAISPSRPARRSGRAESTTRLRAALQGVAAGVGVGRPAARGARSQGRRGHRPRAAGVAPRRAGALRPPRSDLRRPRPAGIAASLGRC